MAKKRFKIGEYAKGGIIDVEVDQSIERIVISVKDFNTQKEIMYGSFSISPGAKQRIEEYLWDITSSYYTDQIMEFIKTNLTPTFND